MPSDEKIFALIDERLMILRKRCRGDLSVPLAIVAMRKVDENTEQPVLFAMEDFPTCELAKLFSELATQIESLNVLRN